MRLRRSKNPEPLEDPVFTYVVYIPVATLLLIAIYNFMTSVVLA